MTVKNISATMSSYRIESGDISAIRFAVNEYIEKTQKDTTNMHVILQRNINLSHVTQLSQLHINEDEADSDYSEYDDHDEGIWYSDPEDMIDDYP
tara:strand:- start:1075 stop:1359 length:285 start_codon:yes stop_codon:yes gene_type:complete